MSDIEKEVESSQDAPSKGNPDFCPPQNNIHPEPVKTAPVNADCPPHCSNKANETSPNPEQNNPIQENILYDSEMEMTISDGAAEIVTVEINAKRNSKVMEEHPESRHIRKGCEGTSADEDGAVESGTNYTPAVPREIIATQNFLPAVQNEVEILQEVNESQFRETESITARRKTRVTSRYTKTSRRTCKQKEPNGYPRKTYLVPQDPPGLDCFNDVELQNSEKSKALPRDGKLSCKAVKQKLKEAHATMGPNTQSEMNRRTFVVEDEQKLHTSKGTKIPHLVTYQDVSRIPENVECAVHTEAQSTDMHSGEPTVQVKKHKNKTPAHPHSLSEECNTLKNRGTFVIQASQSFVSSDTTDILNITNTLEDPKPGDSQEEMTEAHTTRRSNNTTEGVSCEILMGNDRHPECSQNVNVSLVQKAFEFESLLPVKAKKHRKEGADKIKRNVAPKEKSKAKKRGNHHTLDKECLETSELTAGPEDDFRSDPNAKNLKTNLNKADHSDRMNTLCLNPNQTSKCRKTYVISSCSSPSHSMTDCADFSLVFQSDDLTDETNEVATNMNTSMFLTEKRNVTLGSFHEHTRDQSFQITEERPPWESTGGYSEVYLDESCIHSSPPKAHTRTINQDEELDVMPQPPGTFFTSY